MLQVKKLYLLTLISASNKLYIGGSSKILSLFILDSRQV
jgi:hypothetical protein